MASTGPVGVSTWRQRSRASSCGWSQNSCHGIQFCVGDVRLVESFQNFSGTQFRKHPFNLLMHGIAVLGTRGSGGKSPVIFQSRTQKDPVAKALELPLVLNRQEHRAAVARPERAVGNDGGVVRAGALRRFAAVGGEIGREAHPLAERFEHGDVERRTPRPPPGAGRAPRGSRTARTCRRRYRPPRCRPWRAGPACRSPPAGRLRIAPAGRRPFSRRRDRRDRSRRCRNQISRGCFARSSAAPRPSRSAAPGARFCTKTSAFEINLPSISRAAGCFTSSARLSFERFHPDEMRAYVPGRSGRSRAPRRRCQSVRS